MGKRNGLASILTVCHLLHDLGRNRTSRLEGLGSLDQFAVYHRSVFKHIL